ncbi:MAG: hypothetical protein AMXMBFR46_28220 [Acidimicrobiia bacterium]
MSRAAEHRRRADKFRELAGSLRAAGGDPVNVAMAMHWSDVHDDAAHLLALNPNAAIDLASISAGRGDKPTRDDGDVGVGGFIDWPAFWARERSEADFLLEPVLPRGRAVALYAARKVGKSLVALSWAVQLATGADPVVVIYADFEMTENDVHERLVDMGIGPETDLSRLRYWLLPSLAPLDTPAGAAEFLAVVDDVRGAWPDHHILVIIDTTTRAVAGDENQADTIRAYYRHTGRELKARGVTSVRIDHAGKDLERGQRGSSSKSDDVDVVWRLEPADGGYLLRRDASRVAWVPERVAIERHDDPLRFTIAEQALPPGTRELADTLAALDVPATAGVRVARAALKAAGRPAAQGVLAAAVRYRRGTSVTRRVTYSGAPNVTRPVTRQKSATAKPVTPGVTVRNALASQGGSLPPPRWLVSNGVRSTWGWVG